VNDERVTGRKNGEHESERMLERLFSHAEPRFAPPEKDTEEVRRAVFAAWDAATGRRVFLRRAGFASAAAVVLAVGFWIRFDAGPGDMLSPVARVERLDGAVQGADGERLVIGGALEAGHTVRSGAGGVALRLATGGSLRIASESRLVLTGADSAELLAGQLYFDSEGERSGEFVVTTELGSVRDVGTQFLARLDDVAGRFDVGVRDGRVELTSSVGNGAAGAGERLIVIENAPAIRREQIATYGGDWEWTERLARPFDTDGRTVEELLNWFASQTGRSVVFASPEAEQAARDAVIRGSINAVAPLPKLQAALATTTLTYTLDGERVIIAVR
jgi:ferric-dicitrate binding protein FerR (iron transport regulator)